VALGLRDSGSGREVVITTAQPFVNGPQNGWVGAITTNADGLAKAEVQVMCLR
jgi:hypothetical protein